MSLRIKANPLSCASKFLHFSFAKMRFALAFVFACGAFAIPLQRNSREKQECVPGLQTRFQPNTRYTYQYVGTTMTGLVGVTHERTGLKLEVRCTVELLRGCQYVLKVENAKLYDASGTKLSYVRSPGEQDLKKALEAERILFEMRKGRISAVFPPTNEPVYVTNIKRGMLSALQLEFIEGPHPSLIEEVDVTGKCVTRYIPEMSYKLVDNNIEESVTRVTKEKNLTACSNRTTNHTLMNPTFYSNSTKLSPLNSTSRCIYDTENGGQFRRIQCNETHLFKLFSSKQNNQIAGAMTNVTQEMTLVRIDQAFLREYRTPETRTTTLLYEQSQRQSQTFRRDPAHVRAIIEDLVTSIPNTEVRPGVASRFAKLVFAMRRLDKESLRAIWLDYYNCEMSHDFCRTKEEKLKYQQYLIDALSQCGTTPCVHEIVRTIKYDKVQTEHAHILLSGLHLVKQPTPEMFRQITTLMKRKKNLPFTAYLALGSMIRKFCEHKPQDCTSEQSPAVLALDYLEFSCEQCNPSPETVDRVIVMIKALGNAGRLTTNPINLLYCGLDSNYKNVTVAVLQSLRTIPHSPEVHADLKARFSNYIEDPELRMESYLALMSRPTEDDVTSAAETLDHEINTQVGSLVWSHLTALNETEERSQTRVRQTIRDALKRRNKPLRKFNTSFKSQFSQNSLYNERWDIGASVQKHVIYHPESLLPRSLAFNVTADVLGAAVNIFETNLRTEGLETILKKLFGPEGHFPSNDIMELFDESTKAKENAAKPENNRLQRSTKNLVDLNSIDEEVNLRKLSPSAALSFKLFGMELDMFTLKEMSWFNEDIPLFEVFDTLRKMSRGLNKTFTKSALFLEYNHVIPTCLGIPLNISVNGSSVMSLHVEGKADLLGLFWKGKQVVVNGKIRPSATVELSEHMKIDAIHTSSGIFSNLTMSTSTEARGNLTYKRGQRLKLNYNVTERPQEILNVSSEIFNLVNNKLTPIKGILHRNMTGACTSEILNTTRMLGVDLCANISVPVTWYNTTVPSFPLAGTNNFSITLKRTDPKLTTYAVESIQDEPDAMTHNTFITISTPNATCERKIYWNITSTKEESLTSWKITVGKDPVNSTLLGYTYDKVTKDFNITLKTNMTGNFSGKYYHTTCLKTKRVSRGLIWNVTLWNRTINHSCTLNNYTNLWTFVSNSTVYNRTTATPISTLYLNTSFSSYYHDNMTGNLTLNITHQPANFTWLLQGIHNMTKGSTNVLSNMSMPYWSTPLLNHNITLNMTYINTTTEKGLQVNVSTNGSQPFTLYSGYQNLTYKRNQNISVFYLNSTYWNKTTKLNVTFLREPHLKMSLVNITHQNKSLTVNTTRNHLVNVKNVSMNITFMNHSVVLLGALRNYTWEKALCLNGTYQNGTVGNYTLLSTCLRLHNTTERKSLLWNITNENRTMSLNTTWFIRPNLRGILVNCTYMNRTLLNMTVVHTNSTTRKTLDFNMTLGNFTAEFNHAYFSTLLLETVDEITSINISHRIRNGTRMLVNNSYILTFYDTTTKKDLILNLTLWNKTFGTQMTYWNRTLPEKGSWHIVNVLGYTPNRTLNWTGSYRNTTEMLNISSILEYAPKKILNQSFVMNRELNHLNISLQLHPNLTIAINGSGTFCTKINVTTNVTILNNTILWHGFVSNKSLVSNLTLWNRTLEIVSRTCNKTHYVLLNVSTWHHTNQSAFNGSITWYLNATERMMHLNFTRLVHPLNATLYMIAYSRNRFHFNATIYRRNGTEVYNETSLELREDGKIYKRCNSTTFKTGWRMLNNATFSIPTKLLNMTVNVTSGGVNVTVLGNHFRYVLTNITHALKTWNYTTNNVTQNIQNLTGHLLNVTTRSLPNVYANYTTYYHNNTFNMSLFWNNLTFAVYNISRSNMSVENVTEEIIIIWRNFTDSINKTCLIGNLTKILNNVTFPLTNRTFGNVTIELRWIMKNWSDFGVNVTRNFTIWINKTVETLGRVTMINKTIDQHLIDMIPVWRNLTIELLNGTVNVTTYLQNLTLSLRNVTHNVTEYFINVTHPILRNLTEMVLDAISHHINNQSFLGGVVHPGWDILTTTHNISLLNITMETIHTLACNTSLELLVPGIKYPVNITMYFHNMTRNKTLEETIRVLVNKTLEMYNMTLRLPEFYLNQTLTLITNYTDLVTMVMNDTLNVLNVTSNKTLVGIMNMYLEKERNMSRRMWNMTVELLQSKTRTPLNETWAKLNLTEHYNNWTHSMPWHRSTIQTWNSTMFKLLSTARNHTWENYTRHYLPKFVNTTANATARIVYYGYWYYYLLGNQATNTTVLKGTCKSVSLLPLQDRINHTRLFYVIWYRYNNLSAPALNITRNWTMYFLNTTWNMTTMAVNLTTNWTQSVQNLTYRLINTTISLVNGSLVNETVKHYHYLPNHCYFNSLNYTMNFTRLLLNTTKGWLNSTLTRLYNTTSPLFEAYNTSSNYVQKLRKEDLRKIFVPKNKKAMIFGRDHFYTFDKRHFQFPGYQNQRCLYLAARDFREGNFTVMTDRNSLVVLLNDCEITIYRDGRVTSSSKLQKLVFKELPVQFTNTSVSRNTTFIVVNNTYGFELACDMKHFVCSITTSGFYHNSTAGLLGTNNGEQSDDWITPAGKNRTNVYSFVNSWRVRGEEQCEWDAEVTECVREMADLTRCTDLFEHKSSPLSKCFDKLVDRLVGIVLRRTVVGCDSRFNNLCERHLLHSKDDFQTSCRNASQSQHSPPQDYTNPDDYSATDTNCFVCAPLKVDPRSFLTACQQDLTSCLTSSPPEVLHCNVTAAYIQACKSEGIDIAMPTDCAYCDSSDGVTLYHGEDWIEFPANKPNVDVVIMSSEGKRMRTLVDKLPKLVSQIDRHLREERMSPRFGLVGFSGRPPLHRPGHVHTINGKLLSSATEFDRGIENMDFTPVDLPTNISDGFEGIRQAAQYPFRPGATKIFVLFTDSIRVADSELEVPTVTEMMKNISARLIVIGNYRFKKMVGFDTEKNYFYPKPSYVIRRKVAKRLPINDDYFRVMSETEGALFEIKMFETANTKIARSLVSRAIVTQVKKDVRMCKRCVCFPDEVEVGKAVCKTIPNC